MAYLITFYFIALDFFTGLLKAFYTGSFSSKIMRRGLFHKASLLCVMALGWLVEYAQRFVDLGLSFAVPVGGAACVYIILMEIGSILENLCEANPELMPDKLCELFGVKGRKTPPAPLFEGGAVRQGTVPRCEEKGKESPAGEGAHSLEKKGEEAHEIRH